MILSTRSRTALKIASDRVAAKYGSPCGLALGQLAEIEAKSAEYRGLLSTESPIYAVY